MNKNIVDSSGWLEYIADTINADNFEAPILDTNNLLVPTIILYEVFKKNLRLKDEKFACKILQQMEKATIIDITPEISVLAAKISHEQKLGMADSLIYACTQKHNATLYTQDVDFKGLDNVKYFGK